jgi:serine/threonine protein kinase
MATSPTCARCGEPVAAGARFCMKCGSDVSGEQGGASTAMMEPAVDENAIVLELLKKATIGDYEILRELGRGGMAAVYLAHDIALDRKVAVKVMSPALLLMGEGMSERFKREARTAANLSHPNIIPIYAVKSSGKALYFVMKFIPGRSLESIIKELGPMPAPLVRALLQQVGSALGYAHRNGIVHRDVKPANIMIDEEGWTFVTDFGIAKAAENRGLTMTGIAVGTPSYMSPEQCAAKDITGKSDQYSLGVVAYEMLTGKQPFEGDSAMAIMFAHFHEAPKPLLELRPDCPAELAAAVMRMLEKGPEKRYGSMEEALVALGAQPLAHEDPTRLELVKVVRAKSNREILDNITPPPTSPVPPARTRQVAEAATTPIPTPRVVSVTVTPGTAELHPGDTLQLIASPQISGGTAAGGKVTWASDAPATATVSEGGLVTAVAVGSVMISARLDGASGTATIVVKPLPVESIRLEPATLALIEGASATVSVRLGDRHGNELTGREIRWTSSLDAIARVSPRGEVTAVKAGTAELRAESEGKSAAVSIVVAPPAVARITLTPAERRLIAGDSGALSAALFGADGKTLSDRALSWSSGAPSVAAVSARGIVSGLAPGSAEITVRCEGIEAKASITVVPVPVATITVPPPEPVTEGRELALTAVLKDQRGTVLTGRVVTWTSAAPEIATVSAAGVARAVRAGSVKLTAECEGKSWTVSLTVQPVPQSEVKTAEIPQQQRPVPKVEEPPKPDVRVPVAAVGPTKTLPQQGPVRDRPPAERGRQSPAEAEGERPEAKSGRGRLIGAIVGLLVLAGAGYALSRGGSNAPPADSTSVIPPAAPAAVATVEILGESEPVAIGRTRQLAAVLRDGRGAEVTGRAVAWRSSDPAIASVSDNGAVTGARAGAVTIVATSEGKSDEFGLTIEAPADDTPVAVASVAIDGGNKSLEVGGAAQLSVRLRDGNGQALADRTVVWASDDPRIAQVSTGGEVRAVGAGQATISASSEGKSAETRITVKPPPAPAAVPLPVAPVAIAAVELSPAALTIEAGQSATVVATLIGSDKSTVTGRAIAWSSSDERVVRVGNDGTVTAIAKGSATITATAEGRKASLKATVAEGIVPVNAVTLVPGSKALRVGDVVTWLAAARDARGKELTGRAIAWSSSAPQVASVSATGVITALAPGSTEIRVEVEGKSASAVITVSAPSVAAAPPPVVANPSPQIGGALTPRRGTEAGGAFGCGIAGRDAVCWGTGMGGLTAIGGTAAVTGVTVGRAHACALQGGRAVCWGDNKQGQLGASGGGVTDAVPVSGDLTFSSLSAGAFHTCGVSGTRVYCWGRGKEGQLGEAATSDRKRPVPVRSGTAFTKVAAGGSHSCALTAAGKAYCWGDGFSGQLGFGGQDQQTEPIDVSGSTTFAAITAGGKHTCAITTAGKGYCWGANDGGQLGDGSKSDRAQPQAVTGGLSFTQISAGSNHSCGLAGADAYCWGDNGSGQLGDGSKSDRTRPTAVAGSHSFASLSAGEGFTCGVTRAGESYCWGRNDKGQVGDGGTENRLVPTLVR